MSSCKGRMILLFNWTILQGDCHFVEEFYYFERQTENNQSKLSHRETDIFQRLSTINQRNSMRTGQSYNYRSIISWHHTLTCIKIFFCLQFVFDWPLWAFLLASRYKISLELRLFLITGKRLRSPRRLQPRFCGTCTMPYAYWGGEYQSERAPAFRENALWSCVLARTERGAACIVKRNERMKEFEGAVEPRKLNNRGR